MFISGLSFCPKFPTMKYWCSLGEKMQIFSLMDTIIELWSSGLDEKTGLQFFHLVYSRLLQPFNLSINRGWFLKPKQFSFNFDCEKVSLKINLLISANFIMNLLRSDLFSSPWVQL